MFGITYTIHKKVLLICGYMIICGAYTLAYAQYPNPNQSLGVSGDIGLVTGSINTNSNTTRNTTPTYKPFLKLPFADQIFFITEGRMYSLAESSLHGLLVHKAVDFMLPHGTPIYAPVSGFVLASYQNSYIFVKQGTKVKALQGKSLHYGYGYYVVLREPIQDIYIIFGHLSSIPSSIPFYRPKPWIQNNTILGWNSAFIPRMTLDMIETGGTLGQGNKMKMIQAGELLGTVGQSGIERGIPFPHNVKHAPSKPGISLRSRDETHLHMQVFYKTSSGRRVNIDPYNLYTGSHSYPGRHQSREYTGSLRLTDTGNKIISIK